MLAGCFCFVAYFCMLQAQLQAEEGAQLARFREGVARAYAVSLALTLCIKDPLQAALVALVPIKSKWSRKPIKAAMGLVGWALTI